MCGGVNVASAAVVAMYRSSSGRSSPPPSSRSKESCSSGSRSSRSGASTSGSTRRRSPRSPSPRGCRNRPPSPRRTSRERSSAGASRGQRGSEQRDGSLDWQRLSLGRQPQFASGLSPSRHSESSEEQSSQPAVDDDRYGIDLLEQRRCSDRVGSPVDSLSDVNRSDFADHPVFSRHRLSPQSHERYSPEGSPPSSFNRKYNKEYHSRDGFLCQLDFSENYDRQQDTSREPDRDGQLFRKPLYSSEERRQEIKCLEYGREDRLLDANMDHQSLLSDNRDYHKRILSIMSPSPRYRDDEPENSRSKKNTCHDMHSSGYVIPGLTNSVQSSEPQFLHTPEKVPAMPKKSILKKRVDDPSVQIENFLKSSDKNAVAVSADLCDDFLLPHERASQDGSGISHILDRMADSTSAQEKRRHSILDVEDEERFLYGDGEDDSNISCLSTEKLTMHGGKESVSLNKSPPSPIPSAKPDTSERSELEYEKIHDLLRSIGLDIGVAEIGKGAARTQERLHGKKTLLSLDGPSHKADSSEKDGIQSNTHSSESNREKSLSPCGSSQPSDDVSSASISKHAKSKTLEYDNSAGPLEQSFPSVSTVTPSATPLLPHLPPPPNLPPPPPQVSQYSLSHLSAFLAAQVLQNYLPRIMASSSYNAYGHPMAYLASAWPMFTPPQQSNPALPNVHGLASLVSLTRPLQPAQSNLRGIEKVSTIKGNPANRRNNSVLVEVPITPSDSSALSQCSSSSTTGRISDGKNPALSQCSSSSTTGRISDGKNPASEKPQVTEGGEKPMSEQEAQEKKLAYLRTEFHRRCRQQWVMLQNKQKVSGKKKDPLLVEMKRVQENIVKAICLIKCPTAEMKQSHLDDVSSLIGINTSENSWKKASENVDSSKEKAEDKKPWEEIDNSVKECLNNNPLCEERRNLDHKARLIPVQETECGLKRKQCEKQKEDRDGRSAKVARKEESEITKELGKEISKGKNGCHGQKIMTRLVLKKDNMQVEKKEGEKGGSQKESSWLSSHRGSLRKTGINNQSRKQDVAASKSESAEERKCRENKPRSRNSDSKQKVTVTKTQSIGMKTKEQKTARVAEVQPRFKSFDSPHCHPRSPLPPGPPLSLVATSALDKPTHIQSSGTKSPDASTERLPVVKKSNPELVLSPNIAKPFREGKAILKGSQENVKLQKQVKMQLQVSESVSDIIEHARVQKHKVTEAEVQKLGVAEERAMLKMVKMKQELQASKKPCHPPLIPGPPSLLSLRPQLLSEPILPHPQWPPLPHAVPGPVTKGHSLCIQTSQKPCPGPPPLLSLRLRPPLY